MSSALLSVVFVWTSVLSFSSLVSLQGFFHLFIYLSWLYCKYVRGPNFIKVVFAKKTNTQVVSFSN